MLIDTHGQPILRGHTQRSSGARPSSWVAQNARLGDMSSVAHNAAMSLTTAMQFSVWLYPFTTDLIAAPVILCKGNINTAYLMFLSGNKLFFRVVIGAVFKDASDPTDIPRNQWTHYRGIYTGAAVQLQKNDVQVATTAATGNIDTNVSTLRMGDANTANANTYAGRWYDARLWSTATPGDNKSVALVGNETGLVSNWRGSEGIGFNVNDEHANNFDLTHANADQWAQVAKPY